MKIENKNTYSIMYGMDFIKPGEVVEITDKKTIDLLLSQPSVVKYVSKEQVTNLELENEKLKEELALVNLKAEADSLGIKYSPNIGLKELRAKVETARK